MLRCSILLLIAFASGLCSADETKYRYWTTTWDFNDVNLERLTNRLKSIGLSIPVKMSGRASVNLEVSVPLNAPRTWEAYRFDGQLVVDDFAAESLRLRRLKADLQYRDGKLSLAELRCEQEGVGLAVGSANLELVPRKGFDARLAITRFDLEPLFEFLRSRFYRNPTRKREKIDIDSRLADASGYEKPVPEAKTRLQKFELATTLPELPGLVTSGLMTGQLHLSGPIDGLTEPLRWNADGEIDESEWHLRDGLQVAATVEAFRLSEQKLSVGRVLAKVSDLGSAVAASGSIDFAKAARAELKVAGDDVQLGELASLLSDELAAFLDGKLDFKGTFTGELQDPAEDQFRAQLAIASPSLILAGVDLGTLEHDVRWSNGRLSMTPMRSADQDSELIVETISLDYKRNVSEFAISRLQAAVFGGLLEGNAKWSTDPKGEHHLALAFNELQPRIKLVGPMANRLAWLSGSLSGTMSGQTNWTVPVGGFNVPIEHRGDATLSLVGLRLGSSEVGNVDIKIDANANELQIEGDGNVLGGSLQFRTVARPSEETSWKELPSVLEETRFQLAGVGIAPAVELIGKSRSAVDGRMDAAIELDAGGTGFSTEENSPNWLPSGSASVNLSSVRWNGKRVATQLNGKLRFDGSAVNMESFAGRVADGQVQGDGKWTYDETNRRFNLRLVHCDVASLMSPVLGDTAKSFSGDFSAKCLLNVRQQSDRFAIRARGYLNIDQTRVYSMPIGDARGHFEASLDPRSLRWKVDLPNVQSGLAGGKLRGGLHLRSSSSPTSIHMDSRWRVTHVNFEEVLSQSIGSSTIGRGDLTGDLMLSGRNIRSSRDLKGRFRFSLGGTDATAVPGLSTAEALLGVGALPGTRFAGGEAVGQISKNQIRFQDLRLASDRIGMRAEGSVSIDSKRVDLRAELSTGNFQGQDVLLNLAGLDGLLTATPIGQINRIASDRTLILDVVGPARDPIIKLLPAETLRANARRFALQEALGVAAANSLLFD
ncbi:MAG: AsmA-like C-terminal region-containing protein [Planctomycetota bacterium]